MYSNSFVPWHKYDYNYTVGCFFVLAWHIINGPGLNFEFIRKIVSFFTCTKSINIQKTPPTHNNSS